MFLGNNGTDFINKLETRFKALFSQKYAIACNSGTSGLHASLAALDLKPGDEVIVPGLDCSYGCLCSYSSWGNTSICRC